MPTFDWTHVIETLIGTLSGAIIAAFFAWWLPRKFGKRLSERQEQENILRQILISKTNMDQHEYIKCLSYIELAFSKNTNVLDAWRLLYKAYNNSEQHNKNYFNEKRDNLIREIAKVLGYNNETISQLIGRDAYCPKWLKREFRDRKKFYAGNRGKRRKSYKKYKYGRYDERGETRRGSEDCGK